MVEFNLFPNDGDRGEGVAVDLSQSLRLKVIAHRDRYFKLMTGRYMEVLYNLRQYKNLPPSINKYKLESYLRQGRDVIIGNNAYGVACILGLSMNSFSPSNPYGTYTPMPLTSDAIQWTIPKEYIPVGVLSGEHKLKEITELDNGATGDFVVLRNKPIQHISDFELMQLHISALAELEASLFSLIIQAKVGTVIQTEIDSNDYEKLVESIYNGAPFVHTTELLNVEENILSLGNPEVATRIKELKDDKNSRAEELNNSLAINSAGVQKQSGVSEAEVNSNNDEISAVANMYINGIQEPFNLFNHRFGTDYQVFFNEIPKSDLPINTERPTPQEVTNALNS